VCIRAARIACSPGRSFRLSASSSSRIRLARIACISRLDDRSAEFQTDDAEVVGLVIAAVVLVVVVALVMMIVLLVVEVVVASVVCVSQCPSIFVSGVRENGRRKAKAFFCFTLSKKMEKVRRVDGGYVLGGENVLTVQWSSCKQLV